MAKRKPTSQSITFEQLEERAERGSLSKEELRDYFHEDEANSQAFAPAVKLNRDLVDLQRKRPSPQAILELLLKAQTNAATPTSETARPTKNFRKGRAGSSVLERARAAAAKAQLKVLSEGDSWFNLPFWYPPTAIDVLDETLDMGRIARWSAEIAVMVAEKQYRVGLKAGIYRHFLFSGGGNDVLGAIPTYVKKRNAAGTDPANPASFVKSTFGGKVAEIVGHYRTLAGDVRAMTDPDATLYVHGYANAIPKPNGKYLGRPLADLGFDPTSALAKGIVAHMVKVFNTAMIGFAASQSRVVYVDMRHA